jgi:hypothetical protein
MGIQKNAIEVEECGDELNQWFNITPNGSIE